MTLLLTRDDVRALLSEDDCRTAVEDAFRALAEGRAPPPGVLSAHAEGGAFHIKAGIFRGYFAAKINGNFATNAARGLPRIRGVIVLCDANDGAPLAIFDSMEITRLRTAAATAVAVAHLALEDAEVLTICGAGDQAPAQLAAIARVRKLRRVLINDVVAERAEAFARAVGGEVAPELSRAAAESQIIVTCTPSKAPILFREHVGPGTFVAAVGADNSDKQELDPQLMRASTVVTDIREQCSQIGDLHHALLANAMRIEDVHADLGEIVAGQKRARASREEIIIFDSTGMALQDVAASAMVYERAVAARRGAHMELA